MHKEPATLPDPQKTDLNTSRKRVRFVAAHLTQPGNPIINIGRVREAGAMLIALAEERDANCAVATRLKGERDRLRAAFRVNALRWNPSLTHAEIDAEIERVIRG